MSIAEHALPTTDTAPATPRTDAWQVCPPVDVAVADHQLRLFTESPPLVLAMVEDLRTAKQRAWVESYTISDDTAGRAIAEALKERAAAGVDCRLMYDAVGSFDTSQAFFDDLTAAG